MNLGPIIEPLSAAAPLEGPPEAGALIQPGHFAGLPLVLGFSRHWSPPAPEALAAIRRELRGLGALLLLFAPAVTVCARPDDELEIGAGDGRFDRAAFRELLPRALRYRRRRPALSLVIIDAEGAVAWHGEAEHCAEPMTTVARGLSAASRQLRSPGSAPGLVTRRDLLASLVAAFALALGEGCRPESPAQPSAPPPVEAPGPNTARVRLTINGAAQDLELEPRVSLLDVLRERLSLTGTKKGCDHGQCGACTVLIEGRRVNACLTLAVMVRGEVTTIEGLARGDALHPLQQAFVEEDALQCGYCTPGQIMSAVGLLREGDADDEGAIREHMSGNICRCGAYPNIVRAIVKARKAGA